MIKNSKKIYLFVIYIVIICILTTTFACKKETNEEETPKDKVPLYVVDDNNSTFYYMGLYPQTVSEVDVSLIKQGVLDETTGWYTYEENQYAVVKAQEISSPYNRLLSNGEAVVKDKEYAFLVEPIRWKLIYSPVGEMLLLSEKIIDGSIYQDYSNLEKFNDDYIIENEVYANSYYHSEVRVVLSDIYKKAFNHYDSTQIDRILIKTQDNINTNGGNKTMYSERQINTQDALYILSYSDFYNPNYRVSLASNVENYSVNRKKIVSDYAIVKGVPSFEGRYGTWWTRSTTDREKASTIVRKIDVLGDLKEGDISLCSGIVPAIWVEK